MLRKVEPKEGALVIQSENCIIHACDRFERVHGVHLQQELQHGVIRLSWKFNLLGVLLSEVRSEHGAEHGGMKRQNSFMNMQFLALHHQRHV